MPSRCPFSERASCQVEGILAAEFSVSSEIGRKGKREEEEEREREREKKRRRILSLYEDAQDALSGQGILPS